MLSPSRTTQLALLATVIALAGALAWQTRRASLAMELAAASAANQSPAAANESTGAAAAIEVMPASLFESLDVLAFDAAAMPALQDEHSESSADVSPPVSPDDSAVRDRRGDDRWRWDGRDRFGHGPRPMSAELIARCLDVAVEVDAALGHQLRDAREKDPAEFDRQMKQGGFGRRLASLVELKQRDPDLYKIKLGELSQAVQIDRVARQLREAKANGSTGEIELYEAQLRRLLQVQFAMAIKARGELLCRLEERIAELRAEMERDALNFQNIIEARMKVLAGATTTSPATPAGPADKAPDSQPGDEPVRSESR